MTALKKTLLLVSVLLSSYLGKCQQAKTNSEKKAAVFFSLNGLNVINDIYRFDLEGKKVNSHLSHILSAELYNGSTGNTSIGDGDDQISGKGIGISQKWVFNKQPYGEIPYICYGATFRDIAINYQDEGYNTFQENGLEYYRYSKFTDKLKVKSALYSVTTGVQFITKARFVFDAYLGLGYKTSSSSSKYPDYRTYTKYQSSHAYEGWVTQVGFKVGFKFY